VDDSFWATEHDLRWNVARREPVELDGALRRRLAVRFRDDADRLREVAGRDFVGWRL